MSIIRLNSVDDTRVGPNEREPHHSNRLPRPTDDSQVGSVGGVSSNPASKIAHEEVGHTATEAKTPAGVF